MFKNNPPDSLKSFNCNKMKNVLKATKIRRNKDSHKVKQLRNAKNHIKQQQCKNKSKKKIAIHYKKSSKIRNETIKKHINKKTKANND